MEGDTTVQAVVETLPTKLYKQINVLWFHANSWFNNLVGSPSLGHLLLALLKKLYFSVRGRLHSSVVTN